MNLFGMEIGGQAIGAFIAGQASALLGGTIFDRIKRWIVSSLVFNAKNRRYLADLIDEGLDKAEKKDAAIGGEARIGVDKLCDDIKKSIREKDGHSMRKVINDEKDQNK